MITVENKGQFHTSNYTIGVDFITNENKDSIELNPFNWQYAKMVNQIDKAKGLVPFLSDETIDKLIEDQQNQSSYPNG